MSATSLLFKTHSPLSCISKPHNMATSLKPQWAGLGHYLLRLKVFTGEITVYYTRFSGLRKGRLRYTILGSLVPSGRLQYTMLSSLVPSRRLQHTILGSLVSIREITVHYTSLAGLHQED
ncbi:hypothetical protein RRG08_043787 [Elysia crispata]|uniref:Uncharacterized protein n=1 Tax=Elysia crispata TaxID=231223 RepID=A0AAE0Z4H7_9GAST|nr:hypothetical protein RRG08_043787 [Elysia crispata]